MLAYFVMKARMEAAIAGERSALAEARARLEGQSKTLAETIRATEEAAKRQAFDEFLADLREIIGWLELNLEAVLLKVGGIGFAAAACRVLVHDRRNRCRESRQWRGEECDEGCKSDCVFHVWSL